MRNYPCIYTFQTISNMEKEDRIVMTLDAGGTNLVFSALQNGREIVEPIRFPSVTDDLEACLATLRRGFEAVKQQVGNPVAISFAFPGPADYRAGIIGDLPNFPAFRGGVALGPFLEEAFGIPVFINNDGNLFAYGEAVAGILPEINQKLEQMGNPRRYRNLLGVTLGTGFGGGMVANGELVLGDNQMAGYLWCQKNKLHQDAIAEQSVGARAVKKVYAELTSDDSRTPKDIFDIAEGSLAGDQEAARQAFEDLGTVAGHVVAGCITLLDGLVVIGGGLSGAAKYILPSFMRELRTKLTFYGSPVSRLQMYPYNLENADEMQAFMGHRPHSVRVPGTDRMVEYTTDCCMGVALSHLGASRAINLGAYYFALQNLDRKKEIGTPELYLKK